MHKLALDEYMEAFVAYLPALTDQDQRTAFAIYRELSRGQPVTDGHLSDAPGVTDGGAWRLRTSSAALDQ